MTGTPSTTSTPTAADALRTVLQSFRLREHADYAINAAFRAGRIDHLYVTFNHPRARMRVADHAGDIEARTANLGRPWRVRVIPGAGETRRPYLAVTTAT